MLFFTRRKDLIQEAITALETVARHHSAIMETIEAGSSNLGPNELPGTYSAFALKWVPELVEQLQTEFG